MWHLMPDAFCDKVSVVCSMYLVHPAHNLQSPLTPFLDDRIYIDVTLAAGEGKTRRVIDRLPHLPPPQSNGDLRSSRSQASREVVRLRPGRILSRMPERAIDTDQPASRHTDTPIHRYIDTPKHRYTATDTPIYQHSDTPIYRYTDTSTHRLTARSPLYKIVRGGVKARDDESQVLMLSLQWRRLLSVVSRRIL